MIKHCKSCGVKLPARARFCPNCGAAIKSSRVSSSGGKLVQYYKLLLPVGVGALLVTVGYYYYGFVKPLEGKTVVAENPHQHQHQPPNTQAQTSANMPVPPSPEMIEQAQQQLKTDPENIELIIHLANLLFDSGRFQEAIPYYQKALDHQPKNIDVIVDQGVCYFNMQQYPRADELFNQALQIDPLHLNALYNSGIVALQLGNIDKLMEVWGRLIRTSPDSEQAQRATQYLESIHENVEKFSNSSS